MSSQDPPPDTDRDETAAEAEEREHAERDHSVASKLSEELSNWRRRRHNGSSRPRHPEESGSNGSFQSDSARTIKVRGHETLVIRKPKSASPRRDNSEPADR